MSDDVARELQKVVDKEKLMKSWLWAGYVVVALLFYYAGMKGWFSGVTSKLGV